MQREISPEVARLVTVKIGEIKQINTSGYWPNRDRCLVLPDKVKETTESGLICKPQTVIEREGMRQLKATLIAFGGDAFSDPHGPWSPSVVNQNGDLRQHQIGDRIYVKVAAGVIHPGEDGKEYRIVNDTDILGICED